MKSIGIRRNMFLIFFIMCLTAAMSAHAEPKAISVPSEASFVPMSRADRLLLLNNAATLWTMHVSIGETLPESAAQRTNFGLVENGLLSSSFTAKTALYLALTQPDKGKIRRVPDAQIYDDVQRQRVRIFEGVPDLYDLYVSFTSLKSISLEWLGFPFNAEALPKAKYILQSEKGVFVNIDQLFASWPQFMPRNAFAICSNLYPEDDVWILEGEVRSPHQKEGDILRIETWSPFQMRVKKMDGYWRILSLEFAKFLQ